MEAAVSTNLKYAEFDQQSIRETMDKLQNSASTVLVLALQWKNLEEHFTHTRDLIESRAREVQSMEESNNVVHESIRSRFTEVEFKEKEVSERLRAAEVREKEFYFKQQRDIEKISRKIARDVEQSNRKIERVEEKLRKKEKLLKVMSGHIEERYEELNVIEEKVKDGLVEFDAKEREFEETLMKVVSREIEGRYEQLNVAEKKLKEGLVELQVREREFDGRLLESKKNMKAFRLAEEMFEEKNREFKQKNTLLEKRWNECQSNEKTVDNRLKELESRERIIEERCKELELKEKQFEERCKASVCSNIEPVSRKSKFAKVKIELPEPDKSDRNKDSSLNANLYFTVTMDGKALQIFLNERWKEHDALRDDVFVALQLSSNPAKLVLDAMHGFYPPHLWKDGMEFEQNVVMRSCILLLEQLTKILPPIRPEVWKEAKTLAFSWISKMKPDKEHLLQILGFIQLLVSYNLASEFDSSQLLLYMEIVADHIQAPDLLRGLHLADSAHGLIQNLVSKGRNLAAVRFIYAFELVNVLSPVPLIRNCIESCMNPLKLLAQDQDEAVARNLTDVKTLIKSIEEYKLESEFPFRSLKEFATVLEEKVKVGGQIGSDLGKIAQLMCNLVPSKTISPATEPESESALQHQLSSNGSISTCVPSAIWSSHQDGKCFKVLFSKIETHDKAFEFLRCSPNPEKLVLDEIKGEGFQLGVSTQHCILLLEQLRKCNVPIKYHVKEEACIFATKWRLKLETKNQMEVVCFLHFIATYGLASSFSGKKLIGHFGTKIWVDNAADLQNVLGMADVVKNIIQTLHRRQHLEAVKIVCALGMADKFPLEPILKDHLSYVYTEGSKKAKNIEDVMATKISRLKDLKKFIEDYKLESIFLPRKLMKNINRLEKQMTEKSKEVVESKQESEPSTHSKSPEDKSKKEVTPLTPSSLVSEQSNSKEVVEREPSSQPKPLENINKRKDITPVTPLTSSSTVSCASTTALVTKTLQEEKHDSKRPCLILPMQYHRPAAPAPVDYCQQQVVAPPILHPYHRPAAPAPAPVDYCQQQVVAPPILHPYHRPAAPAPVDYCQQQVVAPPILHPYHRPPHMYTHQSSACPSARLPNLYQPVNLQPNPYNENVRPFCQWNGMGVPGFDMRMPFWRPR